MNNCSIQVFGCFCSQESSSSFLPKRFARSFLPHIRPVKFIYLASAEHSFWILNHGSRYSSAWQPRPDWPASRQPFLELRFGDRSSMQLHHSPGLFGRVLRSIGLQQRLCVAASWWRSSYCSWAPLCPSTIGSASMCSRRLGHPCHAFADSSRKSLRTSCSSAPARIWVHGSTPWTHGTQRGDRGTTPPATSRSSFSWCCCTFHS